MFPLSAFNGEYEKVKVWRSAGSTFSKGKATNSPQLIMTVDMVIKPIDLGKVLKVVPDADVSVKHMKFYFPINMYTTLLVQVSDLIERENGEVFGVTSMKDWSRFGSFQSGILSYEKKPIPFEAPA